MLQISVNGKALSFQTKQFSGGEEHIVLEDITNNMESQHIKIHALIRSSSKLMQLLLLVDAIKRRFSNIVAFRSEEHTSELQSRPHLVCRLLLEKKKKEKKRHKFTS